MDRPDMVIHVEEGAQPKKIYGARKVPLHWEQEAKDLIAQLVREGIIEPVTDDNCDWISPAFFVPKSNGKISMVTDFTYLNKHIKGPVNPFPSASEIMQKNTSIHKFSFAKLNVQGYQQVELSQESRHYTMFLLPCGKFRYRRGQMGLKSTSDIFCARSDRVIHNVSDTQKIFI